jgi:50S ribosomal subunit-associated GTPase HflX
VSAREPKSIALVRDTIITFFDGEPSEAEIYIPYAHHKQVRHIYDSATVLGERSDDEGTHLLVRAPSSTLARLQERIRAERQ